MRELLPPDEVPGMPVDEVAVRLLHLLVQPERSSFVNRHNVGNSGQWAELEIPPGTDLPFLRAIVEAWDWLEHHGLVAGRPGDSSHWAYVTGRGEAAAADPNGRATIAATARIDVDLHPLIARAVRRQFILGEYELAVLAAMKEVEIRVRELAKASDSDIGVSLMKSAFGAAGPLRDKNLDAGEQQATMALFWGAIGVFKNPSSHRQVDFDDPTLAAEVILFADLLLRMLDRTAAAST